MSDIVILDDVVTKVAVEHLVGDIFKIGIYEKSKDGDHEINAFTVSGELLNKLKIAVVESSKVKIEIVTEVTVLVGDHCKIAGGCECRFLTMEADLNGRNIYYCLAFEKNLVKDGVGNCVKCSDCLESVVI